MGVKRGLGATLTTHPICSRGRERVGATSTLSPCACIGVLWDYFTFTGHIVDFEGDTELIRRTGYMQQISDEGH
jgi:hypothetical protein